MSEAPELVALEGWMWIAWSRLGERWLGERWLGERRLGERRLGERRLGERRLGERRLGERRLGRDLAREGVVLGERSWRPGDFAAGSWRARVF